MDKKLESVKLSKVTIADNYLVTAYSKELKYLKSLEADRLLAGFRENRGLKPKAPKYGGWESLGICGHTLGHYLTAISQAYASTGDEEIKHTLEYVMGELSNAQMENGYLGAVPETSFDAVESSEDCWVPWYVMHKILSGIIAVNRVLDNDTAYAVMIRLAEWVVMRTKRWDRRTQQRVLEVEYGGMNDCMYELYEITGLHRYFEAAHCFDEMDLFQKFYDGDDVLEGLHANATIPKFLGILRRVMIRKPENECASDDFYLKACINFWDAVVCHHTYVTGGNSEWEHFGRTDILDARRTNCNCETCNSYNMLKLSKGLFELTGDKKYADYYEHTFVNSILASQNPDTGMTTYFQPMASGYFKVFSTPYDNFWCCTGTGMESFTKLGDGIYYKEGERLVVSRYVSGYICWEEKGVELSCLSGFAESAEVILLVHTLWSSEVEFELKTAIPAWAKDDKVPMTDNPNITVSREGQYWNFKGTWRTGDMIHLYFPMRLRAFSLPDAPDTLAFTYGPLVLCASMGNRWMNTEETGVNVTIPTSMEKTDDVLYVDDVEALKKTPEKYFEPDGVSRFAFKANNKKLIFRPYCSIYDERYGIYWKTKKDIYKIRM